MKDPRTEAHSPSFDQLRNNAAECIRLAEAARTSAHKSFFIEMADRGLTLSGGAQQMQEGELYEPGRLDGWRAETEMVIYPLEFHRRSERRWKHRVKASTRSQQD